MQLAVLVLSVDNGYVSDQDVRVYVSLDLRYSISVQCVTLNVLMTCLIN